MRISAILAVFFLGLSFVSYAQEAVKISEITGDGKEEIVKVDSVRTGSYKISEIPAELEGAQGVSVPRGDSQNPTEGYAFKVDVAVVVYILGDARDKNPKLEGWEKTELKAVWTANKKEYGDVIYKKEFSAGMVEIPGTSKGVIPYLAVVKAK